MWKFLCVKEAPMKILKELSRKEFRSKFGSKDQCLAYLSSSKWGDVYSCIKCKNKRFSAGKKEYNKRCSRCGCDQTPTSHTLFHKIKFGIDNTFEMAYCSATSKKVASSIWLAERQCEFTKMNPLINTSRKAKSK
jgi:hypothetical protein